LAVIQRAATVLQAATVAVFIHISSAKNCAFHVSLTINSPQFWMGLQSQYHLDVAQDQLGKWLDRDVRPYAMVG